MLRSGLPSPCGAAATTGLGGSAEHSCLDGDNASGSYAPVAIGLQSFIYIVQILTAHTYHSSTCALSGHLPRPATNQDGTSQAAANRSRQRHAPTSAYFARVQPSVKGGSATCLPLVLVTLPVDDCPHKRDELMHATKKDARGTIAPSRCGCRRAGVAVPPRDGVFCGFAGGCRRCVVHLLVALQEERSLGTEFAADREACTRAVVSGLRSAGFTGYTGLLAIRVTNR